MRFDNTSRIAIVFVMTLAAATASAQDRVIGLLRLPTVLGEGACVPFEPKGVPLYATADRGRPIGTIEVDKNWTMHANGGCAELEVSVHQGATRRTLPTLEHAYEASSAIALDQRGGWVKIRLADGAGWVAPSPRHEFLPLAKLLVADVLAATTDQFIGRLHRQPGGELFGETLKDYQPVRVKEVRVVGGRQWLDVEVLSHSCDENITIAPFVIARGWLPAHVANGEPTVWFYSRGC